MRSAASTSPTTGTARPLTRVLSDRNFRLLSAGTGASVLGDQFSLLATPWLVLQLSGDPAALGLALALQGIPRAVLLVIGGAMTDRLSPRRVLLTANIVRGALTGLLAVAALTGAAQLWMVFVFSALFGVAAGLAVPAETSMVPRLVRGDDLQAGNSVIMGLTQLAGFVGPAAAGILIGRFASSIAGAAAAFAADAATFAVSAATLVLMTGLTPPAPDTEAETILTATLAGVRHLGRDQVLRAVFAILLAVNLLLTGPLMVGIPLLAHQRLPEGATAFGVLMAAFALGNLAGYAVAAGLPRPGGRSMRLIIVGLVAAFGIGIGAVGVLDSTWIDAVVLGLLGLGNGFMAVILITWMQSRTPPAMIGRMMSLMMLATTGLVPLSAGLAGVVSRHSLTAVFVAPGALVLTFGLGLALLPALRLLGSELGAPTDPARSGRAAQGA
jgi:MFS family permease